MLKAQFRIGLWPATLRGLDNLDLLVLNCVQTIVYNLLRLSVSRSVTLDSFGVFGQQPEGDEDL